MPENNVSLEAWKSSLSQVSIASRVRGTREEFGLINHIFAEKHKPSQITLEEHCSCAVGTFREDSSTSLLSF